MTEKGVSADSTVETFAAMQLQVHSWRWDGVPFYIRAGKCLPVTCTELLIRLRKPPEIIPDAVLEGNHLRVRISPDVTVAVGMMAKAPGDDLRGEVGEMIAVRHPHTGDMEAYERVLRDAMAGDATLFAREDYVEEAWRIVDPVIKAHTPVYKYQAGAWGPGEVDARVVPPGGWHNPTGAAPATAKETVTKAA